jgi:hypothetical protein
VKPYGRRLGNKRGECVHYKELQRILYADGRIDLKMAVLGMNQDIMMSLSSDKALCAGQTVLTGREGWRKDCVESENLAKPFATWLSNIQKYDKQAS